MRVKTLTENIGVLLDKPYYQDLVRLTDEMRIPLSTFVRGLIEMEIDCYREARGKKNGHPEPA